MTPYQRERAITLLYKFGIELNDPDTLIDGLVSIAMPKQCPTHRPYKLSYLAAMEDAESRNLNGQHQIQCPVCLFWFWPDEIDVESRLSAYLEMFKENNIMIPDAVRHILDIIKDGK